MKIVIAPDSFKGALPAPLVARAIQVGLRRVWPDAHCVLLPLADGGEGTLDALLAATEGKRISQTVTGPLGTPVEAAWGVLGNDRTTAVVELAQAAGLPLVPPHLRDPRITTTVGVGELILSAAHHPGVVRIIVGLGGSATNDGGAGLLSALGVRFFDDAGHDLPPGGAALSRLDTLDTTHLRLDPARVELLIACDVTNPLCGSNGASAIFGPQKGATTEDVAILDAALARWATVADRDGNTPGAGAAGGAAFGLQFLFPHAHLVPGIDLVLDAIGFDAHLLTADLVITGEGKIDAQTLDGGKAAVGVARRVREQTGGRVPTVALVGAIGDDVSAEALARAGLTAVMPLSTGPETLADALSRTETRLAEAAHRAAQWMDVLHSTR